jgi:hypothetical protein
MAEPPSNLDFIAMRIEGLEDELQEMKLTLYGNRKEVVNGGGLVGEVRRLAAEFRVFRETMRRPVGWVTLVIVGGALSLLMHLVTLLALLTLARLLGVT